MYGRRYQRKCGFKRAVVTLLSLVMLLSVCFPGLQASAEDVALSEATKVYQQQIEALQVAKDQMEAEDPGSYMVALEKVYVEIQHAFSERQISEEDFASLQGIMEDAGLSTVQKESLALLSAPDTSTEVSEPEQEDTSDETKQTETTEATKATEATEATEASEAVEEKDDTKATEDDVDNTVPATSEHSVTTGDDEQPFNMIAEKEAPVTFSSYSKEVEQGGVVTIESSAEYLQPSKFSVDGSEKSDFGNTIAGITVTYSNNTYTVSVSDTVKTGEYTIKTYYEGFIRDRLVDEITLTVTEKETTGGGTTTTETKRMTYDKTATAIVDGNGNPTGDYNLELTLSGAVGTESNKAKVDVVFIVDNSNSMYPHYMSELKPAMKKLVTNLSETNADKIDARYGMVVFGTKAEKRQGFTNSGVINNQIDNLKQYSYYDGGTNYQAGIYYGKELLNTRRSDAMTVVVFVTDGKPTYRGINEIDGNGGNDNGGKNIKAAVDEIKTMSCNYFFALGLGDNLKDTMKQLADNVKVENTPKIVEASKTSEITAYFDKITQEITTYLCQNVTITDKLNHEDGALMVQVTDPNTVKVTVTKTNGTVVAGPAASVTLAATSSNESITLTPTYNVETGVLQLDFPDDYQLEPDYVYKLSAVISPTEKAYEVYRENGYTDTADVNTGTHSGSSGFYSNDEATVTYTYNSQAGSVMYDHPVVRLNPGKLVVTKQIVGMDAANLSNLTFQISLTGPDADASTTTSVNLNSFVQDSDTGIYYYSISGLSPNTTYSVTETGADVDQYNVETTISINGETATKAEGTVGRGATETIAFVNTYTLATTNVTISKTVDGNMGDYAKSFPFVVSLKDGTSETANSISMNGIKYTIYTKNAAGEYEHGTPVTVSTDTCHFSLKHNQKIQFEDVPIGAYMTVQETSDYVTTVVVNGAADTDAGTSRKTTFRVNNNDVVEFTNTKDAIIDTGVAMDSVPFVVLFSVAAISAGALLLNKRRYTGKF